MTLTPRGSTWPETELIILTFTEHMAPRDHKRKWQSGRSRAHGSTWPVKELTILRFKSTWLYVPGKGPDVTGQWLQNNLAFVCPVTWDFWEIGEHAVCVQLVLIDLFLVYPVTSGDDFTMLKWAVFPKPEEFRKRIVVSTVHRLVFTSSMKLNHLTKLTKFSVCLMSILL